MAHFAKIENNTVTNVIVINDDILLDKNGIEQETLGSEFCALNFGGEWVQTSYNQKFRGSYAHLGITYDRENDIFTTPEPNNADEV